MPTKRNPFSLIFFALIFFLAFVIFGFFDKKGVFIETDIKISQWAQNFQNSFLFYFLQTVSVLEFLAPLILLLLLIVFHLRKMYGEILFLILSTGYLIPKLVKEIYQLGCPAEPLVHKWWILHLPYQGPLELLKANFCFPSGHVFSYVTFFGFLIFLTFKLVKKTFWRDLWLVILLFTIIFVAPSRIYLGAHWTTDVIGGYLLGFSYLLTCIFLYEKRRFLFKS